MGISLKQYEVLCKKRRGEKAVEAVSKQNEPLVIIGIDPSLRCTGYGVISVNQKETIAVSYGAIRCPEEYERSKCLLRIVTVLRDVISKCKPNLCVVEGLFYAQNVRTALIMGEARGASLLAAAEAGLDIYEIAPRKVKKAITGYGAAHKKSVARMVQRMLGLKELPEPDATDALAIALTYAQENSGFALKPLQKI